MVPFFFFFFFCSLPPLSRLPKLSRFVVVGYLGLDVAWDETPSCGLTILTRYVKVANIFNMCSSTSPFFCPFLSFFFHFFFNHLSQIIWLNYRLQYPLKWLIPMEMAPLLKRYDDLFSFLPIAFWNVYV